MNTYIEQLKAKYNNPQKAYKYYALSKTLLHHLVVSDNAPQEIKDIIDVQQILDSYCNHFIEATFAKELHEFWGFSAPQDLSNFMWEDQNFEKLHFLEINYDFRDSILDGTYQQKITEISKQITWGSLEKLIISENSNNIKLIDQIDIDTKLKRIVDDFGLVSICVGNIKITDELIEKTYNSLEQLSIVVKCDKKQVGLNKLNLCLDGNNGIDLYSGYVDRFKSKHLRLYVTSSIMEDLIAHEWFHFLDIAVAEYKYRDIYGPEIDKYRLWESQINKSFNDLREKASKNEIPSFIGVNEATIISHIEHMVDKYVKLNIVTNAEQLKLIIKKEVIEKQLNDQELIKEIEKFQTNTNNGLSCFILSEINLLKFDYAKNYGLSLFITYAFCIDKNMRKLNLLHKDESYSTELSEVAARIFESYVNIVLKEKNIKNIISQPEYDFHTPQEYELKLYINDFESILDDMRKNLNLICPLLTKDKVINKIVHINNNQQLNRKNTI